MSYVIVVLLFLGAAAEAAAQGAAPLPDAGAQGSDPCRFICELAWKFEPTITVENLANRHRVVTGDGVTERATRDRVFEIVLALDLETKVPWLGFTAEAITAPFEDGNEVELEFESNFHWLTESMTRGWVTSHFDVVDKFSPAERPDTSARLHPQARFRARYGVSSIQALARGPMAPWIRARGVARLPGDGLAQAGRRLPRWVAHARRRQPVVALVGVRDPGGAVLMPCARRSTWVHREQGSPR